MRTNRSRSRSLCCNLLRVGGRNWICGQSTTCLLPERLRMMSHTVIMNSMFVFCNGLGLRSRMVCCGEAHFFAGRLTVNRNINRSRSWFSYLLGVGSCWEGHTSSKRSSVFSPERFRVISTRSRCRSVSCYWLELRRSLI